MAQRYFHKVQPAISITLPNGSQWKNWNVIDHGNGVIAPESAYLLESLDLCVKQGVGGVTEIKKAEYDDWIKKKQSKLPRLWREEWAPRMQLSDEPAKSQPTKPSPSEAASLVVNTTRPTADD